MKIEIDTKSDSKEEIRQVIKILMTALGEHDDFEISNDSSRYNQEKSFFRDAKKDNEGYINLFAPNEEISQSSSEAKSEANPLSNFFGNNDNVTDYNSSSTTNSSEDYNNIKNEENEDNNSFFKEFDDNEDKNKKPKIQFY